MRTTSIAIGLALSGAVLAVPVNEREAKSIPPNPQSPWFRAWGDEPITMREIPPVPTKITLPYRPVEVPAGVQARDASAEPQRQHPGQPDWYFDWTQEKRDAEAERNPFLWTFDWSGAPHKRDAEPAKPWYEWKKDWFTGEKREAEPAKPWYEWKKDWFTGEKRDAAVASPSPNSPWFVHWDDEIAKREAAIPTPWNKPWSQEKREAEPAKPWYEWKKDWFTGEKRDAAIKPSSQDSPWFVHWDDEISKREAESAKPWSRNWFTGEKREANPPHDGTPWYNPWFEEVQARDAAREPSSSPWFAKWKQEIEARDAAQNPSGSPWFVKWKAQEFQA